MPTIVAAPEPARHASRTWCGASARAPGARIDRTRLHRQRNALARYIHLLDANLDDVAGLHHLVRILDEPIRQLGDVDEAVLVHADVDERAEVGDVGDDAFELHARLQVVELLDAVLERRGLEFGTRIAARLFQLRNDVDDRRHAEVGVGEIGGTHFAQKILVADHRLDRAPGRRRDTLDNGVGLGMDGGTIERVLRVHDAQEARRLLEGFRPEARHLLQARRAT